MNRSDLRSRIDRRADLIGTFVKISSIHSVEALGRSDLDCIVVDQEHAPLDRAMSDAMLIIARAAGLPALVRVPSPAAFHLQSVLDSGAAGVLVPHVSSVDVARSVASACRYVRGRGYSGATRSAQGCGDLRQTVVESDRDVVVVVQIEDHAGLSNVEDIAACDGVDGVFIGRADLAVALGADSADAEIVWDAARRIAGVTVAAGKLLSGFAGTPAEAGRLRDLGATLIISGSDQAWLTQAANRVARDYRPATGPNLAPENHKNGGIK